MITIKRYMLFGGDSYYPGGGWYDLLGQFDSLAEAVAGAPPRTWLHIVDLLTGEIVMDGCSEDSETYGYPENNPKAGPIVWETRSKAQVGTRAEE